MWKKIGRFVWEVITFCAAILSLLVLIISLFALGEDEPMKKKAMLVAVSVGLSGYLWFYLFKLHSFMQNQWVRFAFMIPLAGLALFALFADHSLNYAAPFIVLLGGLVMYDIYQRRKFTNAISVK